MITIDKLDNIPSEIKGCCLTIGNFDGVHLGHQKIMAASRQMAGKFGNCPVVAMTFEPHPVAILHPEKVLQVLTPLPLKRYLLEKAGVDYLIVLKDSYELLTLSPESFVDGFLRKKVLPKAVVEGRDFNFGYGRSGSVELLALLGKRRGFDVNIVDDVRIDFGTGLMKVSSTLIRLMLQSGNAVQAAMALGTPYRLMGRVVKGRGIGKSLGFPTANIEPHDQIIPAEGVYAGLVSVADNVQELCDARQNFPAVFSLGRAKTFVSGHPLLIEAHLLDGGGENLYDKFLAMDFIDFIRGQRRFENEEKLKKQIGSDCEKAKEILLSVK
jgi:riboflavin kinase / FMN adenylyltransferase